MNFAEGPKLDGGLQPFNCYFEVWNSGEPMGAFLSLDDAIRYAEDPDLCPLLEPHGYLIIYMNRTCSVDCKFPYIERCQGGRWTARVYDEEAISYVDVPRTVFLEEVERWLAMKQRYKPPFPPSLKFYRLSGDGIESFRLFKSLPAALIAGDEHLSQVRQAEVVDIAIRASVEEFQIEEDSDFGELTAIWTRGVHPDCEWEKQP
jgi:hypothetical protein